MTISASEPTAMVPFLGKSPNSFAGALEAFLLVTRVIEEEILWTGLSVSRQSHVPRLFHLQQRVVAAQVHDVDRRARHLCNRDRPRRALGLSFGWARQRVILGRR